MKYEQKTLKMKARHIIPGIILLLIGLGFYSCRKDLKVIEPDNTVAKVESMHELKVADDFSWKTIRDVEIDFEISSSSSLIIKSPEGDIYHKAMVKGGERYLTRITLPTYETQIVVFTDGKVVTIPVSGSRIVNTF